MSVKKLELSPSVSIIIAGVIVAGAIVFANMHPAQPTGAVALGGAAPSPTALNIRPVSASDHITGSPNASIVLVEFSDFQCPYCSMVYPTLKKIVDNSNGQIAWVYRQLPLTSIHPNAGPAALASECIAEQLGNTGFWKYADAVFTNQASLSPEYSATLAKQFGADSVKYTACIASAKYQSKIDADTTEAEANGGNGTPFTIVINTKTKKMVALSGALPEAQFMTAINSIK
ncbi:MAG: thioredoxin domain-containing protein [bacterium]